MKNSIKSVFLMLGYVLNVFSLYFLSVIATLLNFIINDSQLALLQKTQTKIALLFLRIFDINFRGTVFCVETLRFIATSAVIALITYAVYVKVKNDELSSAIYSSVYLAMSIVIFLFTFTFAAFASSLP